MGFCPWGFESPLAHHTESSSTDETLHSVSAGGSGAAAGADGREGVGGAVGDDRDGPGPAPARSRCVAIARDGERRTDAGMPTDTSALTPTARAALTDRSRAAQTAAGIRHRGLGRATSAAPTPTGAGGLAAVADEPRPPRLAEAPAALREPTALALPRLDRQERLAIRHVCHAVGWQPDTPLQAFVDMGRGRLWVQHADPPAECDCARCGDDRAAALALPGEPRRSPERVAVDAADRLVLTAGLRRSVGVEPRTQVVVAALAELHAVVVLAPAVLLGQALDADAPADPATPAGPSRDTPSARKELA